MTHLKKYLSKDGTMRLAAVISTDLANEAFQHYEASPLAKTLMSRALTGAVLMASQTKSQLGVALHFQGNGSVRSIFASAQYEGAARVYCENRMAELPQGSTHLGAGLGEGRLDVIQSRPYEKEPTQGTVELFTGEIGDDIAFYLNQSQQIPAIVSLAARPAEQGMEVAGGYILELMPGYSEATIIKLESLQSLVESTVRKLQKRAVAEDLIDIYLDHFEWHEIQHPYSPHYLCSCSIDRVERSLLVLGAETLEDMIRSKESADVTCEFCGKAYRVDAQTMARLMLAISSQA